MVKRTAPRRTAFLLSIGLALCLVMGCTDSSEPDPSPSNSDYSHYDSAGVLVSVTQESAARSPLSWTVDSVPLLAIGSVDEPSESLFRVQGLRRLPDGGILVVDGGSRELRYFDAKGQLRRTLGGKGEGPGEFDDPVLVSAPDRDSLLVWDTGLRRFQVFSNEGEGQRTLLLRERWPAGGRPPLGAVGGRMLVQTSRGTWMVPAAQQTEGPKDDAVEFLWYDPVDGSRIPIASFSVTRMYVSVGSGRPPSMSLIPFVQFPIGTVSENMALLIRGTGSEVLTYNLEGRLSQVFRVEELARPVTGEMIDAYAKQQGADDSSLDYWRQLFAEMPIPEKLPAFQSIQVDELGWVWTEVFQWDPTHPKEWVVFDPDGRARGTIQTPPGLRIEQIGEDFILGVSTDDLGVEYVRLHSLTRGAEAGNLS